MNILVIGNMGYVGPELIKYMIKNHSDYRVFGYDIGYFMCNYTTKSIAPEVNLCNQYFGDVRSFKESILDNIDAVVYLAAISNDPIGNLFEGPTMDINYHSAVKIANLCKEKSVKSFVFASSCSVYGLNQGFAKTESDSLNPLTAYAKSKINAELELEKLVDPDFSVTCLRFATACGMSDRLRLDLVLNDFVASAVINKRIEILSDGSPYRPLINVKDMARAIDWAISRKEGDLFETLNVGSNNWNYQIKDLAYAVKDIIGSSVVVEINHNAQVDKRSYQVNFDKFESMAFNYLPLYNLEDTILELQQGLGSIGFNDSSFRNSHLIRLNVIRSLISSNLINSDLKIV